MTCAWYNPERLKYVKSKNLPLKPRIQRMLADLQGALDFTTETDTITHLIREEWQRIFPDRHLPGLYEEHGAEPEALHEDPPKPKRKK